MEDAKLQFDRRCHVLYTKACKREICAAIARHYPRAEREAVWEKVQLQYVEFLKDWRTDLGGQKNFHNGRGGTYDNIALLSYYTVCREATDLAELEQMEGALFLPAFRRMRFVNVNLPIFKRLMYRAFCSSKRQCDRWGDYVMQVQPFEKGQPIRYQFTACPVAEFAKKHNLLEAMPALCNPDYTAMELIHAKLVRTKTCACGELCDYAICGDQDAYCKAHPEYVDEAGFRRNRP